MQMGTYISVFLPYCIILWQHFKLLYMKKYIHTAIVSGLVIICCTLSGIAPAAAQSIRLKSSSEKHFKVIFTGTNKAGQEVTKTLENVDLGFWKTISLYKTKYGYDLYNNKEMKSDGADATNRWKRMVITDEKTSATDELDITSGIDEKKLPNNHLWIRIKLKYDNDYLLTYISLFDHRGK
jgi:hypothetical protein